MIAHVATAHRKGATLLAFTTAAAVLLMFATPANAALHATVPLGTAAQYAVLGSSTVTNTGPSTLNGSLGVSPGTSITGFPPGKVIAPGTTNRTNAAAAKARADLTAAYIDAAGRPIDGTVHSNLANMHLQAGVYAGPSHGALSLTGPLVLDGAGNANSVFIFQTNSSLITASSSTVSLINGAQECNVFWQVGSSATLGTGSVFTGNILALTSISVTSSVTVHGRALARNGAVTLDNDTFTRPTCAAAPPGSPTAPPSLTAPGGGAPTAPGATPNAVPGTGTGTGSGAPPVAGPPRTDATPLPTGGSFPWQAVVFVALFGGAGTAGAVLSRRRVPAPVTSTRSRR
jgi:Ice-binding-like